MRHIISFCIGIFCVIELGGVEVIFSDQRGVESTLEIDGTTPIYLMNAHIENHLGANVKNVQMMVDYNTDKAAAVTKDFRDYYTPVTPTEVEKINYIVKTLGTKAKIQLFWDKSSLDKTGDQIRHLHPLKFLTVILTNQDNIKYIRIIRDKGRVWDNFGGELKGSLKEEAAKDNLKYEYVADFAEKIKVDINLIWPDVQNKKWTAFVDKVIYQVPYKK
ncbi:MAG: hypothetical protein WC222_07510 [Parachlamydiales bacterium]|jgi:hypothetical protein